MGKKGRRGEIGGEERIKYGNKKEKRKCTWKSKRVKIRGDKVMK